MAFDIHSLQRLFVLLRLMLPPVHIQGHADKDTLTLKVHQDTVITDATNQCQSASSPFEKE